MKDTATDINVVPRTLRRWRASWRRDRLRGKATGRPKSITEASVKQSVITMLAMLGPEVGIPTLEWIFPYVSRSTLVELTKRYRRLTRLKLKALLHVLIWHRVGAVWAADFSTPPLPIDGVYKRVFNVRDLASGRQLMSMPVIDDTAACAIRALETLVRWFGAPLVLKCDNGSAFIAHETRAWARSQGLHILYSPPQMPAYNGAIEAGTGSIETRAYHHASRHGRPWEWTCDDLEHARREANATSRPKGRKGPTPDDAWNALEPLCADERSAFDAAYRNHEQSERRRRGIHDDLQLQRHEQAGVDRAALARTLIELGFLSIRRRRITPRIPKRKADRLS
jgi:putative transposase